MFQEENYNKLWVSIQDKEILFLKKSGKKIEGIKIVKKIKLLNLDRNWKENF